jgi:hypothetical protein
MALIDDYGNRWTGTGRNIRPVMGNPANMPAPPSPNATPSPIRTVPPMAAGGSLGASLLGAATSPAALGAAGVVGALYPRKMGDATLNSPEAQKVMAQNDRVRANQSLQSQVDAINARPIPGAVSPPLKPTPQPPVPPAPGATSSPSPVPAPVTPKIGNAPGAVPTADMSRQVSPDRQDSTVARRGERNAFEQPLLAQGYQPAGDSLLARTQGAATDYQTPQGSMTMQGGMMGASGRQGGGTLSFLGGRTPEEQAGIDERVAGINRQTEALRQFNIDTGRSYAPGSFAASAPQAVDPFARAGDSFGDSQMRATKFESLLQDAGGRGVGKNQRKAMIDAAQGMLAPGMGAAELQGKQQASRDSLLGQLTQAGATQNAAQLSAQQKMQEAQQRLGLDTQRLNQEQQMKGGELTLNALKTFQGMGEAQQQQAKADLYNAYAAAVNQGDQATMTKLQPLMDYLYPQKQQNDTLAALLQQTPK